jgi:alpha-tubulin suppressor-like RCC1 family protein
MKRFFTGMALFLAAPLLASCKGEIEAAEKSENQTAQTRIETAEPETSSPMISIDGNRACALTGEGDIYCWGQNEFGQLGDGTETDKSVPVKVKSSHSFKEVSVGMTAGCGLAEDGAAYCWGKNDKGQLGDGTQTNRSLPVAVTGEHTFKTLSVGFDHACGVTENGRAYCWGYNKNGQLGDGTTTGKSVPVAVRRQPGYQSISASSWSYGTCALSRHDEIWCWGRNELGQLGLGTFDAGSTLSKIVRGELKFDSVSYGHLHVCGLTLTGEGYCWGDGTRGKLGNGGADQKSAEPVAIAGGLSFKSIGVADRHSCGVATSGDAYCWGANDNGQLGDGSIEPRSTPTLVEGGLKFETVSVGGYFSCGITVEGRMYCWGQNKFGQLGDGTMTDRHVPSRVTGLPR